MVESAVSCYVLTSCEGLSQNMVDFVHKRRAGCEMHAYSSEQIEMITSADAALKRHERESGERSKSLRREAKNQIEQLGNVTRCEKIRSASERSGPSGSDARGSPATTAADAASKARAHASQGKRDGGSSDSLKELMEPTNPQWLRVCTKVACRTQCDQVVTIARSCSGARGVWLHAHHAHTRSSGYDSRRWDSRNSIQTNTRTLNCVCSVDTCRKNQAVRENHALLSEIYFSAGEVRAPACFTVEPLLLHAISILKQVRASGVRYLDVDTGQGMSRKM